MRKESENEEFQAYVEKEWRFQGFKCKIRKIAPKFHVRKIAPSIQPYWRCGYVAVDENQHWSLETFFGRLTWH